MNKKIILILCSLLLIVNVGFSQAKKPTIMILPSDVWCSKNGYMTEFNNQGTIVKVPDYKKAFQENSDLLLVISKINGMMSDRGFPLKNAESVLKTFDLVIASIHSNLKMNEEKAMTRLIKALKIHTPLFLVT